MSSEKNRNLKGEEKSSFHIEIKGIEIIEELISEVRGLRDQVKELINQNKKKVYTIKEASDILGISKETINNKIKVQKLKCIQDGPRSIRRISSEEIERYIKVEESKYTL